MTAEKDPAKLPWKELGVDVVIESTGFFTERDNGQKHLDAGRQEGDLSAPAKDELDATIVLGVNDDELEPRAPDHLERLLHHQLPGADGQGARRRRSASRRA